MNLLLLIVIFNNNEIVFWLEFLIIHQLGIFFSKAVFVSKSDRYTRIREMFEMQKRKKKREKKIFVDLVMLQKCSYFLVCHLYWQHCKIVDLYKTDTEFWAIRLACFEIISTGMFNYFFFRF